MSELTFSHDDLVQAVRDAQAAPEDDSSWWTVVELAAAAGICEQTARKRLRALAAAGRLEVGSKWCQALPGFMRRSPAYRLRGGGRPKL